MRKFAVLSTGFVLALALLAAPVSVMAGSGGCGTHGATKTSADTDAKMIDSKMSQLSNDKKTCSSKDGSLTNADKAACAAKCANLTDAEKAACATKCSSNSGSLINSDASKSCASKGATLTNATKACGSEGASMKASAMNATESRFATATFSVKGMTCGGCEKGVSAKLTKVDGVNEVLTVCHKSNKAVLTYDPAKIDTKELTKAIASMGYETKVVVEEAKKDMTDKM